MNCECFSNFLVKPVLFKRHQQMVFFSQTARFGQVSIFVKPKTKENQLKVKLGNDTATLA